MFKTGQLVIPIDIDAQSLDEIFENCKQYVSERLLIKFHSEFNDSQIQNSLPRLSHLIQNIYTKGSRLLPKIDIQVQLSNLRQPHESKVSSGITDVILLALNQPSNDLRTELIMESGASDLINVVEEVKVTGELPKLSDAAENQMYDTIALGGTFDYLHVGHKILLTEAVLRTKRRVVVGVTDEAMIAKKKLFQLISSVTERMQSVEKFLNEIDGSLLYEVVSISDPFGPTATDPDMDLIVVSEETKRGAEKINEVRTKSSLKPLITHVIPLINEFDNDGAIDSLKEPKVSSSNRRLDLLGTLLRPPVGIEESSSQYKIFLTGPSTPEKKIVLNQLSVKGAVVHESIEAGPEVDKINVFNVCDGNSIVDQELNEIWFVYKASEEEGSQLEFFRQANVVLDASHGEDRLKKQLDLAWELLTKRFTPK